MNKLKKNDWIFSLGALIASLALIVTTLNVNTACFWVMHQDEIPDSAKKLRKF